MFFKLFWCANIKYDFFKKYIILMYFQKKKNLKKQIFDVNFSHIFVYKY